MLINLKVKTLDAQTHEFSIDNEVTVRQFKDKIAERTNIAAEQQRIIYCGRVLADEKQLKEYDVDGKVVHVAERPPPSQRGPSTSSAVGNDGNPPIRRVRSMRGSPLFRAMDGMVVGTMAIPMNTGLANTQMSVNPFTSSSSFCMNRITVARHMLDCANNIAAYLEDPDRGLNNTSLDILARGRWTMESTVVEVGITAADLSQNQNIVEMVQGAVSAALRRDGNTNVTVVQLPTVFGSNEGEAEIEGEVEVEEPIDSTNSTSDTMESTGSPSDAGGAAAVIIEDIMEANEDGATNASSSAAQAGSAASNSSTSTAGAASANAAATSINNSTSTGTNTDENPARRRTGTNVLGEVIEQMRTVQTRLNPFIQQFYELLQNEPTFEENDTTGRESAQRLYDRVSEAFHYMSHAQHAISDLMLDVSQPAPRYLTCRPILVEQSGYVSSNNYLSTAAAAAAAAATVRQQQPHATAAQRANATAENNDTAATANATPPSAASTPNANQARNNSTATVTVEDPIDEPVVAPTAANANAANAGTQSNDNHQMQMARLIQAVVNSAPIDTEFHVQINAPSIVSFGVPINAMGANADARSAANGVQPSQTNAAANEGNEQATGNDNNATAPGAAAAAVTPPTANTSPTAGAAAATAPTTPIAVANQVRVNTATLPTTSTQTRSTSRPQLQIGNIPPNGWNGRFIPSNMMSSFDRFLPCNSHHIREPESTNANGNGNGGGAANSNAQTAASAAHNHNHNMATTNNVNQRTLRTISDLMHRVRPTSAVGNTMMAPHIIAPTNVPNLLSIRNLLSTMASTSAGNRAGAAATPTTPPAAAATATNAIGTAGVSGNVTGVQLRNLRRQMLNFLNTNIFQGDPINDDTMQPAINRAVHWFGETLNYLPQYEKPEYDSRDSVLTILRRMLPSFIELLKEHQDQEELSQFERRLKGMCEQFMKRLYSVLYVCVGRANAELYWIQLMRGFVVFVQSNFEGEALQFLRVYMSSDIPGNADTADAQQFIVKRIIPAAQTAVDATQPMELDVVMNDLANAAATDLPSDSDEEYEPAVSLPNVIVGSESWHQNFPNDWLPIITRDLQTQAEHPATQTAYSDAYISGMSAKRRKMLQSNKPPTDVRTLIADSVRKAIQTVGVTTSTASNQLQTPDEITSAIASDNTVQASYTEAVRTNVRERLKKDPDYDASKYPHTTEFVNK